MALFLADRVQQTGTANTTVSFTLSGSVTGFQTFAAANVANNDTTYYGATDASGNWEVGVGTYSTTGPTLTRTTILSSSNSGSAVTFSGTVNVFITYPSERSVYSNGTNIVPDNAATLLTTSGGTGLSSYTAGDLPYYATGTALSKLAIGASGRWLGSSGTAPQWNAPAALTKTDDTNVTLTLGGSASTALLNDASLTLGWTGQLAVTRGGTGLATVAQGDILYGSAANTLSALPKNTTATRYLANTGTSNNPAWAQVDLSNGVTGTLPVGNGGTGTTTAFTAGSVVFAGASGVYSQDNANFFWDDTNNRLGLGNVAPACALDVTGGIQTSRTGVTSPAATDGNVFSGTYTPIQVSTNTNVDSVTFGALQYIRVGTVITVCGQIAIDATTATTDTIVKMSLPIASNFASSRQLAGVGSSLTTPYAANNLAIIADTTNDCVEIRLRPSVNTSLTYNFIFNYVVV